MHKNGDNFVNFYLVFVTSKFRPNRHGFDNVSLFNEIEMNFT